MSVGRLRLIGGKLTCGRYRYLTQLRNLAVNQKRISNLILSKMRSTSVLLGKKVKGPHGLNSHAHEMRSPKEIVIADDINAYQLFRDAVFIAPQEELLEGSYRFRYLVIFTDSQ